LRILQLYSWIEKTDENKKTTTQLLKLTQENLTSKIQKTHKHTRLRISSVNSNEW